MSVVIVTRDRPTDLAKCLESLASASNARIDDVVIVDDASAEPPVVHGSTLKIRVVRNNARSFLSTSRNEGARDSTGRYIMFIDDDNIVGRESIGQLSNVLDADPRCMVASPAICYTSRPESLWFAGGKIGPISGIFAAAFRGSTYDRLPTNPYYTGVFHDAFMVKREAFERVGFFDERNFPMYLSEADLAARLRENGFRAVVVPAARMWHSIAPLDGASSLLRGVHITEPARAYFVGRNRLLYMRKHGKVSSFLIHVAVFEPVIISIHLFAILTGRSSFPRAQLLASYLRGVIDGVAGRTRMGRRLLQPPA